MRPMHCRHGDVEVQTLDDSDCISPGRDFLMSDSKGGGVKLPSDPISKFNAENYGFGIYILPELRERDQTTPIWVLLCARARAH